MQQSVHIAVNKRQRCVPDHASCHGVAERHPEPVSQRRAELHSGPHQVQRQQEEQGEPGLFTSPVL